jgi:hypothetical protein
VIEPRVYRAAFVPAVVAVVLAMFSLENQPPPAPIELAADVLVQGESVADAAASIARREPDRRAGTPGDAAIAELVATGLSERGFEVEVDEFAEDGRELRNVVGTRPGRVRERIVIAAARDADSVPDLTGSAADTAALLELATAIEGRAPGKTIVIASLDGSTLAEAGARRFAATASDRERVEAVLVLSDLGAPVAEGPRLVTWSNDATRVGIVLRRTAAEAVEREFDVPVGEGVAGQIAHLAFPVGVGAQGVLLDQGFDAIRFSGSGLLPPNPEPRDLDAERLGGLGRAVLQTLSAVDAGPALPEAPGSYLVAARNVLPEWVASLLALTLVLPALVASVDALARARRRRKPVGKWGVWVIARAVPFAAGLLAAILLVLVGLVPNVAHSSPAPSLVPIDATGALGLGLVAATVALAWIFLRPLLVRWGGGATDPAAPGAACAVALASALAATATWALNPYAALALVPAAHLWALGVLNERPRRARSRGALLAGGLLVPAAIAIVYMVTMSLDPLQAAWYLLLLVGGGQVPLATALLGCVLLAALAGAVEIVVARRRRPEAAEAPAPAVRGPRRYAGPGSLGGTESALRRR